MGIRCSYTHKDSLYTFLFGILIVLNILIFYRRIQTISNKRNYRTRRSINYHFHCFIRIMSSRINLIFAIYNFFKIDISIYNSLLVSWQFFC